MILSCLRLARQLRGGARKLPIAMERALEIWSGGGNEGTHGLGNLPTLPSPALLQRAELALDVAFMLFMREEHPDAASLQGQVRWIWADSSPQQGFDWLWVQIEQANRSTLLSTFLRYAT